MATKSRPSKRTKLMSDDSGSDSEGTGVPLSNGNANGFTINQEYANRFEHNKRREEKHRLEEKYKGTGSNAVKRKGGPDDIEEEEESSSDETEDDDAELATADLDEEIQDALQAIRRKDPRVYDSNVKFYRDWENEDIADAPSKKKEKPMRLQDYHRQNLLAGNAGGEEEDEAPPQTYQQEQDALRKEMVGQMHGAGGQDEEDTAEDDPDADEFFQKKQKQKHDAMPAAQSRKKQPQQLDVENAEKDPENYLSNFMAARAWLPTDGSQFAQLDSDDSEEDKRADAFEEAYNMRFEDPRMANEKLQTFARDVGKFSARRDEVSGRQKARERERAKKDEAKKEREEERARLRKLRIDEVEQKVSKIKEAAGLKGKDVNLEEWRYVLDDDWDDNLWEQEMKRRFGEDYYAQDEAGSDVEMGGVEGGKKHKKIKKPKWDDDVDIKDLVPDFEEEEAKPDITLSSDDEADGGAPVAPPSDDEEAENRPRKKSKRDRERETTEKKRSARKERQKIEQLVDATMPLAYPNVSAAASSSKRPVTGFRYRETSPTTFGMNSRDILFADDTALNEYAGLKKLAAWRDSDKKKRDKKRFSKKQRLKQWRKDTFGNVEGPKNAMLPGGEAEADQGRIEKVEKADVDVVEGERKKKRKRSKKSKTGEEAA